MNDPKLNVLVLSASLNPNSNSAKLAQAALTLLEQKKVNAASLDLREVEMPFCDGATAYDHPAASTLKEAISQADAILFAAPVYNFDLNAAAKNVIELTGQAWEGKVVGLMVAAGGSNSYMSPMALASSLMFDFRSYIVPRFVYATTADFDGEDLDTEIKERLEGLVAATLRLAKGLALVA